MKKYILLCVLVGLLTFLFFDKFVLQFVWVNPNVNKTVFPYIAKAIKEIDNGLNHTVNAMNSSNMKIKILYKNAYGSGFLKNNPIPNDLDFAVGVYLGEYEYNSKNGEEIAKNIHDKMTIFQTEFYDYINNNAEDKFYSNYNILDSIQNAFIKRQGNIEAINKSLPEIFKKKDYVIYTTKTIYDAQDKPIKMSFPFILKKNEIMIEDYSPILLYSNLIKYNENNNKFLRETTIVIDFYADIKQNNEVVHAEIVAESFTGQRLQITRRFFVPIVFIGNSSAKYLKNLNILTDNDKYVEYRLFNFKRHLQEFANLNSLQDRPVKLFKRVLQCTDLIAPLLSQQDYNDIQNIILKNLNNPKIQMANDLQTGLSNMIEITAEPNLYLKAQAQKKITNHTNILLKILEDMKNSNLYKKEDIKFFEDNLLTLLNEKIKTVNSKEKLEEYHSEFSKAAHNVNSKLDEIINENITDKDKILKYVDNFYTILYSAGFHKINICWLDKNLIGVVKDEFTSKIPDLKDMAQQNNLADVEYKFITKDKLAGPKVRYSLWVRYNSTDKENINWQNIQNKLLQDKKNFNIKRHFSLLF